jgi:hypothetical protein
MHTKNKIILSFLACVAFCLLFLIPGNAQSLSLEKDFLTDYLRNQQLIGAVSDSNKGANAYSFAIRPLDLNNDIASLYKTKPYKKGVSFLPLVFNSLINSHHPVGQNFGVMLPTVSPQLYLSAGVYFKHKRWEFQFQPEIIYSNNRPFETFKHENYDPIWWSYYKWLNNVDAPEQFGTKPILKAFPGQSKIQYNFYKDISVGISTQNIWWGPGIKNSLLMTNNAAGFLHVALQTNKPIVSKWGTFEAQMVFGKLDNSTIFPPDTNRVMNGVILYNPKPNNWRYFTGYTFSFQPKWVPGLFLGASKSTSIYNNNMSGPLDLLPFAGLLVSNAEKANLKATYGSVFFRFLLKEARAEVYAEYGRNDRGASIVNLITDKNYNRGYVVGFRKITNENRHHIRFEVTTEFTNLQATNAQEVYNARSWYINSNVRQGYTQLGKIMGAGIGSGGKSQSIDISILKRRAKMGIMLERIVQNNDFYYNAYYPIRYWKKHWIDMSALYHAYFEVKKHLFVKAQVGITRSLNYNWWEIPLVDPVLPGNGYDPINVHGNLTVVYHW